MTKYEKDVLREFIPHERFDEAMLALKQVESRFKVESLAAFFAETEVDEIANEPTSKVYKTYWECCTRNKLQPMSNIEFSRQVKKHFKLGIVDKRVGGVKCRIFVL